MFGEKIHKQKQLLITHVYLNRLSYIYFKLRLIFYKLHKLFILKGWHEVIFAQSERDSQDKIELKMLATKSLAKMCGYLTVYLYLYVGFGLGLKCILTVDTINRFSCTFLYLYRPVEISSSVFVFSSRVMLFCWWSSSRVLPASRKDASASSAKLQISQGLFLLSMFGISFQLWGLKCETLGEKSGYLAVITQAAPCVRCMLRRHVRTSSFSSLLENQRGSVFLARAKCFCACGPKPGNKGHPLEN